jgi:hypothetical protein
MNKEKLSWFQQRTLLILRRFSLKIISLDLLDFAVSKIRSDYSHLQNLGHGRFFSKNSLELSLNSNLPVAHSILHVLL